VTVGLGFRLITPLTGPMPIAIDFGVPIVKGPFDQKQLVAFYVGFGNF
jgi:outer membrane protein insertion porin family